MHNLRLLNSSSTHYLTLLAFNSSPTLCTFYYDVVTAVYQLLINEYVMLCYVHTSPLLQMELKKTAGSRQTCFGVRLPGTLDYPTINLNPHCALKAKNLDLCWVVMPVLCQKPVCFSMGFSRVIGLIVYITTIIRRPKYTGQ